MEHPVDTMVKWFSWLDTMCRAMREPVYVILACHVKELDGVVGFERRAAKELLPLDHVDNTPIAAHGKVGELIVQGLGLNGQLVKSPIEGNELSHGWLGAVAYKGVGVGISGLAQQHDLLIGLCGLYRAAVDPTLLLHHVGKRFGTEEEFVQANLTLQNGMLRPASDHKRAYGQTGKWYVENQWFDDPAFQDGCRHWDFVARDPKAFLYWIAQGCEGCSRDPVWFEDAGPHDPVGCVTVTGISRRGSSRLAIMARGSWWSIEDD